MIFNTPVLELFEQKWTCKTQILLLAKIQGKFSIVAPHIKSDINEAAIPFCCFINFFRY